MIEYASNRVPLKRLFETGGVLALIAEIVGTSYRDLGTMMAFGPQGQRTGSLSSGCIEDDIAEHAAEVFKTGAVKSLRYGQGSPFFDLTLPCGGGLSILLIPNPDRDTLQAVLARGDARHEAALRIGLKDGSFTLLPEGSHNADADSLVVVLQPELRFWVYGHGIEAISFALMAQAAGYHVSLFGQEGLHSDLTRLDLRNMIIVPSFRSYLCPTPDRRTAIALFFHDHENEARLLAQFLPSDAFFIGAQGSLKARQRLLADLATLGVTPQHLANLSPSFGLIGSCRDPRTLAVSVLAHVLSVAGAQAAGYPGNDYPDVQALALVRFP